MFILYILCLTQHSAYTANMFDERIKERNQEKRAEYSSGRGREELQEESSPPVFSDKEHRQLGWDPLVTHPVMQQATWAFPF